MQVRNAIKFHSLDILNKTLILKLKWQSVEHATAARTFAGSSLGNSLVFDQNLGICPFNGSEKIEHG